MTQPVYSLPVISRGYANAAILPLLATTVSSLILRNVEESQVAQSSGTANRMHNRIGGADQVTQGHHQLRQHWPMSPQHPWIGVEKCCCGAQNLHATRKPMRSDRKIVP